MKLSGVLVHCGGFIYPLSVSFLMRVGIYIVETEKLLCLSFFKQTLARPEWWKWFGKSLIGLFTGNPFQFSLKAHM